MFDFLKTPRVSTVSDDETGTYADAFLQMAELQAARTTTPEPGHEAHIRDYGNSRKVARGSLGFA
ncbi:hypothetical protein RU07_06315 [Agrobacterium tumefaciens]|uniref:Uncharacterized protein n=1 Tax=Agrobacterium tumefaciens TaxID=358 RepID=A0A0D0K581_AGRTU|nr:MULTISPECIES: hypothetical protein [Rhizobium]KIQ03638.1 hypothetical protein RU07_06315 [Agrobacterium tumefaciens]MCI9867458.1 hypothetical protein [Rhizobium skierniewicense]